MDGQSQQKAVPFPEFDGMALPPLAPLREDAKKRFDGIRNLECRKDDVILAAYPKSGSNWLWEVIGMLLKNKAENKTEYTLQRKVSTFLESVPDLSEVDTIPSPRTLNTHVPYRWLPKQHLENGGKIVHVMRNPKDVAVSMFHFLPHSKDFKTFYDNIYMSPVAAMGGWFAYEKEFEKAETSDERGAILTLHYESMKKNPKEETKRLAKFLDVDLKDEVLAEVVHKCSFQNLKTRASQKDNSDLPKILQGMVSKVYRKGEIGDWKNHFTVAMNEEFDQIFEKEMKNSEIKVQFE